MESVTKKPRNIKKKLAGKEIILQMLKDKKHISSHLQNGGNFEELKKQGYKFATV